MFALNQITGIAVKFKTVLCNSYKSFQGQNCAPALQSTLISLYLTEAWGIYKFTHFFTEDISSCHDFMAYLLMLPSQSCPIMGFHYLAEDLSELFLLSIFTLKNPVSSSVFPVFPSHVHKDFLYRLPVKCYFPSVLKTVTDTTSKALVSSPHWSHRTLSGSFYKLLKPLLSVQNPVENLAQRFKGKHVARNCR